MNESLETIIKKDKIQPIQKKQLHKEVQKVDKNFQKLTSISVIKRNDITFLFNNEIHLLFNNY